MSITTERAQDHGQTTLQPFKDEQPKIWQVGTLTYTRSGLGRLFSWLLWGDFAWSMKERAVGAIFIYLLTQHKASNTVVAVLMSVLPSMIGLVIGPVVSFRSDRYRSRYGRRIPFLLIATPFAALAMMSIGFSPMLGRWLYHLLYQSSPALESAATLSLNQCILIFFGIFWVLFEIATITANSVFGAFVNDVVPQPLLGRFFALFRAVSLIAGMIFNRWLIESAKEHYVWLFVGIAILYSGGFTAMCLRVKEGQYPPPEIPESNARKSAFGRFAGAVRIYCRECYSKPYYLWVFLAFIISGLTFMPINLYSMPYAESLGISLKLYGVLLFWTYLTSLVLSYFLGWLADRFHPLRVGMLMLILYSGTCVWGGFSATSVTPFAVAFIIHGVFSGAFMTATASLAQRLYPRDKFAQFASASSILGSVIGMTITFLFGIFLDWTGSVFRYAFFAASLLSLVAAILLYVVYRKFQKYGGTIAYKAPE